MTLPDFEERAARMTDFEHRGLADERLVLREQGDGMLRLSGYASVVGVFYDVGGVFREKIARGAIGAALAGNPDVVLNLNHGQAGTGLPLARTKSATGGAPTLRLSEDRTGLRCEADLDPEDDDTQLVARKLRAGLLGEMSFAFIPLAQDWNFDGSERTVTALSIDGGDVSVVIAGANPATSVSVSMRAREVRAAAMSRTTRPTLGPARDAAERLAVLRARGLR